MLLRSKHAKNLEYLKLVLELNLLIWRRVGWKTWLWGTLFPCRWNFLHLTSRRGSGPQYFKLHLHFSQNYLCEMRYIYYAEYFILRIPSLKLCKNRVTSDLTFFIACNKSYTLWRLLFYFKITDPLKIYLYSAESINT